MMAMISLQCGQCGAKLRAKDDAIGKKAKCPKCGAILSLRRPTDSSQECKETGPVPLGDGQLFDMPESPPGLPVKERKDGTESPLSDPGTANEETPGSDGRPSGSTINLLLYPVNVSGIIHILIFSLLPPLWTQAMTLRFWMAPGIGPLFWLVLLTLYLLYYLAVCLDDSAQGGTLAADVNSASMPLSTDTLLSYFLTIFPAIALIWGPVLAYRLIKGRADWILVVWMGAVGFVSPMVLLAVNYFDSLRGAHPRLVLMSIVSVLGPYCRLLACLFVLTGMVWLLMYLSGLSRVGWVLRPGVIYLLMVEAHLLGRFYARYEGPLNWDT
jgi:DNA-directed RNA polymerase subunit RPC12/RpoP